MANREACELYIEQEIEEGLKQGKKPYSIGKELSAWVEKMFETHIPQETIRSRVRRLRSNDQEKSKPAVTIENFTPEIIKDRQPQGGGYRENAGRPAAADKLQPEIKSIKDAAERLKCDLERIHSVCSPSEWRAIKEGLIGIVRDVVYFIHELGRK